MLDVHGSAQVRAARKPIATVRSAVGLAVGLLAGCLVALAAASSDVQAQARIEAGLLTCQGEGGWGAILGSRREFMCELNGISGRSLGRYRAVVTRFGLDIGVTGPSVVIWAVFAPADLAEANITDGALEGEFVGVGAEASVGLGLGANALIGGGPRSFALQPLSVEAQTGLNLAIGVQQLSLVALEP